MNAKKILANDGIHAAGKHALEEAGFVVITDKVEQGVLADVLPAYDGIIVRSATKVRAELIDQCPNLSFIARGGVGMDNIDVQYARDKGVEVYNTPAASSQSVAELVVAHMLTTCRMLQQSNRQMPETGHAEFKALKKQYAAGAEVQGKTMGIIGIGRIGQAVAKLALGMGMHVLASDPFVDNVDVQLTISGVREPVTVQIEMTGLDDLLRRADFVTLHVPSQDEPILGPPQFELMRNHTVILNASRGGAVDEAALLSALDNGKLGAAGLDVFSGEPTPKKALLNHPLISVSPHIGASTDQAQINIGLELAEQIIAHFSS